MHKIIKSKSEFEGMFSDVYYACKRHGTLLDNKFRDEWEYVLPNKVIVNSFLEDGGYTQGIIVKGLFIGYRTSDQDVKISYGSWNGLVTIHRMMGLGRDDMLKHKAILLHDKHCQWNHTDVCSWEYEITNGQHDWTGWAHKEWLKEAEK